MYQFIKMLGWAIVILYALSVDRYFLRLKPFSNISQLKALKVQLVKFHKPLGVATLCIAFVHGFLAFNNIGRSYTGALALMTMLAAATLGILMHYKKISMKNIKVHRFISVGIVLLIVLHIVWPYIFVY